MQEGSKEYKDFWTFLAKYQALEKKTAAVKNEKRRRSLSPECSATLGIPLTYDREQSLPFELLPRDPAAWLDRIGFQDTERGGSAVLGPPAVCEFRQVLATYMAFLQREKFGRLRKLREGQANLPIAEYRQEILTQAATLPLSAKASPLVFCLCFFAPGAVLWSRPVFYRLGFFFCWHWLRNTAQEHVCIGGPVFCHLGFSVGLTTASTSTLEWSPIRMIYPDP